ncbi:hypothetical protein RHA1_ro11194 (plasmid) [Rhodococcus jostii RHA1]|uniref:Uncharacterized protein n=1 Tax=Rhodococcus jostii (strain RHA1) TaxID=101510 RepID=Q0RV45_RHOJR|nr:hypothetical protein RHA1_ro11194 [Rhodococcus jostii RHA1]
MRQYIKPPAVCRCHLTTSADSVSQFGETPYRIPRIGEPYLGLDETGHFFDTASDRRTRYVGCVDNPCRKTMSKNPVQGIVDTC